MPDKVDLDAVARKLRTAPLWIRGGAQFPLVFEIKVGEPDTSAGSYWCVNVDKLFDPATQLIRAEAVTGYAGGGGGITSIPDVNGKPVKNLFVTADGKLKVEYEDGT